jgi:hypothetical protein
VGGLAKPLLLNRLLNLNADDLSRTKIKFNLHDGGKTSQIETYLRNPEKVNNDALFWRSEPKRFFYVGQIAISLVQMSWDTWLLATIKEVTHDLGVIDGVSYKGFEKDEYQPYYGRTIIKYKKRMQTAVIKANTIIKGDADRIIDMLEVQQILPQIYDGDDFPGYDKVRLSYEKLSAIIQRRKQDWVAALENQKGVYLITDMNSGKQYVGSATGDNGMLGSSAAPKRQMEQAS